MMNDLRAVGVAAAFVAGDWAPPAMADRARRALDQEPRRRWVRTLAEEAFRAFPTAPTDRPRELATVIEALPSWRRALVRQRLPETVAHWYLDPTRMAPARWPVARLDTLGDLGALVGLTPARLRWFADPEGRERTAATEPLRHYRYRWRAKPAGGVRLVEEPKPVLKHLQRVVLRTILAHVPPHEAAHGFRPGRSAVTFAAGHVGRATVIHLDLEDFFGTVAAGRVYGLYRTCGYPEDVAHLLTALATNTVPSDVLAGRVSGPARNRLAHPHLPQGAPASPALANLVAFGLDRRLAGLATSAGLHYSRYADDLALSAPDHLGPRRVASLLDLVGSIVTDEGWRLHPAKTTVRHAGQRQRLAGVVVNDRPNIDRRDHDRLKATLTNARRHGPASQNRDGVPDFRAHLQGRVAWVAHLNPTRGARLQAVFDRIDWDA